MTDLNALKEKMNGCSKCPSLCESRGSVAFGSGVEDGPKIMLIAESPNELDELGGKPFYSDDGKVREQINKILNWVGVPLSNCFITNSVLCRTPNGRTPLWEEIKSCRWRLLLQIKLINPEVIVCLGKSATSAILNQEFKGPLNKLFSDELLEFSLDGQTYSWLTTYHPSYLVRRPSQKKEVISHWQLIKDKLCTEK